MLHIKNSNSGAAALSPFLSGPLAVTDPVTGTVRQFDEMARREEDLNWLVTDGWVGVPVVRNSLHWRPERCHELQARVHA